MSISMMKSIFFFSSRRRHTRCGRDWSSDVCSSDLPRLTGGPSFPGTGNRAVTPAVDPYYPTPLHPLHALLLAGSLPLFLGTLLSDITYYNTYQIQWSNFASWLLAGALLLSGLALLCALIGLFRRDRRQGPALMYFVMLLEIGRASCRERV